MIGMRIAGKAFCVVEDLRQFAELHKGKNLAEFLQQRRLEEEEAKQFGMTLAEYRMCLHGKKGG